MSTIQYLIIGRLSTDETDFLCAQKEYNSTPGVSSLLKLLMCPRSLLDVLYGCDIIFDSTGKKIKDRYGTL